MPLLPNRDHKKRAQDSASPEAPLPRAPTCSGGRPGRTLPDLADGVHVRNFGRRRRDSVAELRRLEDFRVGAELEQLAVRLLQALEPDGVHAVAALQLAWEMSDRELAGAQLHLDARP